ncbi:acyl CoA binding protein-domain-containing protein [Cokeromyces recurvatus]|uniref:acyl CoA binding protein-domain-containing protein n=1 Tax=Cokeromyces recurvatus TaxID=90255 RepID=UPI00221F0191|nr:acyl CoA binding protein-domain-containing protein [Cokeromyces recurvatus]KAI7904600.1 acyl CoA binding protein-domain-containing protein [Cokeromyces recurvatus]
MTNIPPHYSDHFITQRYNKALYFVQHLHASSSFQPTKNQKLELYALYKQVSEGNISTQRPGLFDVVGRAKWDAWKKLEGLSQLEARHLYVEALLRIATEAYKKNAGREEAQRIIHAFAIMRPSGNDESDDDLLDDTTDDATSNQGEDSSVDTEEQAYLRDIQESKVIPFTVPDSVTPYSSPDQRQQQQRKGTTNRPGSVASIQTMVTAPETPRQLPLNRPPSSAANNSNTHITVNRSRTSSRLSHSSRGNEKHPIRPNSKNLLNEADDFIIDANVNPWQQIPTISHNTNYSSNSSDDENHNRNRSRTPINHLLRKQPSSHHNMNQRLPSSMMYSSKRIATPASQHILPSPSPPPSSFYLQQQQLHGITSIVQQQRHSPVPGSSTSSSVTATPQNLISDSNNRNRNYLFGIQQEGQSLYTVALDPTIKRALESLQNEVTTLNERVDGLRREIIERDKQRKITIANSGNNKDDSSDNIIDEGWKWVFKAALKYAGINLLTVLILFLILYKSGSPLANVILKQASKLWYSIKFRTLIANKINI